MEAGDLVTAHLCSPREQMWGQLVRLGRSGVELRGIDLSNFEEWCRQLAGPEEPQLGPSNVFFPAHRIERITLDERVGAVPSFTERFADIVGRNPQEVIGNR